MILIIFGTRPEFIKLAPVILELQRQKIPHKTISTGQHHEMLMPLLDWFGIVPDFNLAIMKPNQTLNGIIHSSIEVLDQIIEENQPKIVITQGDTTTAFVASLAAFNRKVRVAHVEAGLRTNNIYNPFPEEANRRLISQIATFHFTPTLLNTQNLIKSGIPENQITETGNTVIDALLFTTKKNKDESHLSESIKSKISKYEKVITVTGHRRENIGEAFTNIFTAIKEAAQQNPKILFIYPVHLNPKVKNAANEILHGIENVFLTEPLDYPAFVELMSQSYLIISDSGGIQEEAPSLNVPVLVTRINTERMEAVNAKAVMLVGTEKDEILEKINLLLHNSDIYEMMKDAKNPYGDGSASVIIVEILKSAIYYEN